MYSLYIPSSLCSLATDLQSLQLFKDGNVVTVMKFLCMSQSSSSDVTLYRDRYLIII